MSEPPRSSIDHRYDREPLAAAGHEASVAPAPPYPSGQAISVGLVPQSPTGGYVSPVSGGVTVLPGTIIQQPPVYTTPVMAPTVVNQVMLVPTSQPCPVCGKALGDKPHDRHDHGNGHGHHGPPPAPRFSKATPEVFRDGFKPLWDSAQAEQASFVVVSGCNKLLDVLLKDLEGKVSTSPRADRYTEPKKGFWARLLEPATPDKPTFAKRIEKLRKEGVLLQSTVVAVKDYGLSDVLNDKIDAAAVTSDMAKRYVHLLWQVADQGFEQPQWSAVGEPPKAVAGPPEGAHGHGHDDHGHTPLPAPKPEEHH